MPGKSKKCPGNSSKNGQFFKLSTEALNCLFQMPPEFDFSLHKAFPILKIL
jgi:hypothetical protein